MPRRRRTEPSDLRLFLDELDARLDALSARALKDLLRAHARQLPRRERPAFLRLFPRAGTSIGEHVRSRTDESALLLEHVEGFFDRLDAGAYVEDAWHGRWRSRDSDDLDESGWRSEVAELFGRADRAFLVS